MTLAGTIAWFHDTVLRIMPDDACSDHASNSASCNRRHLEKIAPQFTLKDSTPHPSRTAVLPTTAVVQAGTVFGMKHNFSATIAKVQYIISPEVCTEDQTSATPMTLKDTFMSERHTMPQLKPSKDFVGSPSYIMTLTGTIDWYHDIVLRIMPDDACLKVHHAMPIEDILDLSAL